MKVKHVSIEMNDDGTMQIEASCRPSTGFIMDGKMTKRYSAKSADEIAGKIAEAEKAFSDMKDEKKEETKKNKAGKPVSNKSMKEFIGEDDGDYDD